VKWLQAALFELGIGAKTAAGYGVFVDPKPING
jgi:CRISPR/Cas system CMR subunit Cmr6 (Cas7 group RAMP superfamily)